jgi:hypothetical protein
MYFCRLQPGRILQSFSTVMHVNRFSPEKKIQKRSWYSHGRQAIEGKSEERESGTMCNLQVQHSNWGKKFIVFMRLNKTVFFRAICHLFTSV